MLSYLSTNLHSQYEIVISYYKNNHIYMLSNTEFTYFKHNFTLHIRNLFNTILQFLSQIYSSSNIYKTRYTTIRQSVVAPIKGIYGASTIEIPELHHSSPSHKLVLLKTCVAAVQNTLAYELLAQLHLQIFVFVLVPVLLINMSSDSHLALFRILFLHIQILSDSPVCKFSIHMFFKCLPLLQIPQNPNIPLSPNTH